MNIDTMTGQQLLAQVDNRAFWGSLQVSAWWYNRKKHISNANGRKYVFFELFIAPGKYVVLDHLGNRYDNTDLDFFEIHNFPKDINNPNTAGTVWQGTPLGEVSDAA